MRMEREMVERAHAAPAVTARREVRELALTLLGQKWSSLALVPVSPGETLADLGETLAQVGTLVTGRVVRVLDATGQSLEGTATRVRDLESLRASGGRAVVVVSPFCDGEAGIPLAQACDAAVLCIRLGDSERAAAEKALALVGRDRVLGAVLLE